MQSRTENEHLLPMSGLCACVALFYWPEGEEDCLKVWLPADTLRQRIESSWMENGACVLMGEKIVTLRWVVLIGVMWMVMAWGRYDGSWHQSGDALVRVLQHPAQHVRYCVQVTRPTRFHQCSADHTGCELMLMPQVSTPNCLRRRAADTGCWVCTPHTSRAFPSPLFSTASTWQRSAHGLTWHLHQTDYCEGCTHPGHGQRPEPTAVLPCKCCKEKILTLVLCNIPKKNCVSNRDWFFDFLQPWV